MTKIQAFKDGFVGKPIKNEHLNLWYLTSTIREKQARLYKDNAIFRKKQIEQIAKNAKNKKA